MICKTERTEFIKTKENDNIGRKVLPVCFLCGNVPKGGIKDGFFLKGIFICSDCERELINSRAGQKEEEYMLSIAKLRHILFRGPKPR